LSSGDIVELGGRSHQPGPDQHLLQAFIGSEGTLGFIGRVAVRLIPQAAARGTIMATFDRLEDAGRAVGAVLAAGVVPLALELMDRVTLTCVEGFLQAGLPTDCEALLLADVDGSPDAVGNQVELVS